MVHYASGDSILYEVKDRMVVITLNIPKSYNALTGPEYRRLEQLLLCAAVEPGTFVTLIQSTGKFFSAGANFKKGDLNKDKNATDDYADHLQLKRDDDPKAYDYFVQRTEWVHAFGARNLSTTDAFINHPKVLVVALNGPVIGLSAAIVAHADLIYAMDNTFLLTPFSNIGLVAEGAASYTLLRRLGLSKANEALLMSKPIPAQDLKQLGFLNELYPKSQFASTEDFNAHVQKEIRDRMYGLNEESVLLIKKQIRTTLSQDAKAANHDEVIGGVNRFADEIPQKRFDALKKKSISHKL